MAASGVSAVGEVSEVAAFFNFPNLCVTKLPKPKMKDTTYG